MIALLLALSLVSCGLRNQWYLLRYLPGGSAIGVAAFDLSPVSFQVFRHPCYNLRQLRTWLDQLTEPLSLGVVRIFCFHPVIILQQITSNTARHCHSGYGYFEFFKSRFSGCFNGNGQSNGNILMDKFIVAQKHWSSSAYRNRPLFPIRGLYAIQGPAQALNSSCSWAISKRAGQPVRADCMSFTVP